MKEDCAPDPVGPGCPNSRASSPVRRATLGEKRFSPSKLVALIAVASSVGLDPHDVLCGTGLDLAAIANPFTLTSTQQFLTAARNAIHQYPGSDLGIRVGGMLHASSYGMFGYAALCAETMAHAFDSAVKFHRLANGVIGIWWDKQGETASWHFPAYNEVVLPEPGTPLYYSLIDMQFALPDAGFRTYPGGRRHSSRARRLAVGSLVDPL
ncbi:AraC family transcriptional regulator ligand-binding domain-containing protein [Paraburkholderia denitrificans]|uniref:AraC family transcriptional regulator ligand-binding domain-containing protein n=1 Tax=Paraburkholderia denitrificans TaxID=694025 RepID=A0ABW0J2P7_9BURK